MSESERALAREIREAELEELKHSRDIVDRLRYQASRRPLTGDGFVSVHSNLLLDAAAEIQRLRDKRIIVDPLPYA
jgi:hypothetical protein